MAGDMGQVVGCLCSKYKALSSNPSTAKKSSKLLMIEKIKERKDRHLQSYLPEKWP
jgi:hypothetical protein